MSATNPDGGDYHDPGIRFISYFTVATRCTPSLEGSTAPPSLGCVEMALGPAGGVYPYTPIGTIVHVDWARTRCCAGRRCTDGRRSGDDRHTEPRRSPLQQ